jgi:hypothetical protein
MQVAELLCRIGDCQRRQRRLGYHLGPLAVLAVLAPSGYLEAWPHEPAGDETPGGAEAGMCQTVNGVKNGATKGGTEERAKNT